MTDEDVRELLRLRLRRAGSQTKFAKEHQLTQGYLSEVLSGKRNPGPRICEVLGIERVVTYRRIRELRRAEQARAQSGTL